MSNVHDSSSTVQFDTTLRQLAAQATARYAGEKARIDRGLVLALNGHVTLHADGTASVQSGTDAEIVYTVNGHCDCPDVARAPEGRCKHRWAKCLVKRAIADPPAPVTYYATYTTTDGLVLQGTAQWLPKDGWLFIDTETDHAYLTQRSNALVLGGHKATADAKRAEEEAAGGLVAIICGYGK
jgi:hypothetical protein